MTNSFFPVRTVGNDLLILLDDLLLRSINPNPVVFTSLVPSSFSGPSLFFNPLVYFLSAILYTVFLSFLGSSRSSVTQTGAIANQYLQEYCQIKSRLLHNLGSVNSIISLSHRNKYFSVPFKKNQLKISTGVSVHFLVPSSDCASFFPFSSLQQTLKIIIYKIFHNIFIVCWRGE